MMQTGVSLKNCALLGYYTWSNGNFLATFRYKLSGSRIICPPEDGTDRMSRNVGKKLLQLTA